MRLCNLRRLTGKGRLAIYRVCKPDSDRKELYYIPDPDVTSPTQARGYSMHAGRRGDIGRRGSQDDCGDGDTVVSDNTYLVTPAIDDSQESPSWWWRRSVTFVLCSIILERVGFYSYRGSLVYFLTKEPLCWPRADASAVANVLSALSHFFCFPFGAIPDLLSSKAAVIVGYAFYIVGYSLATIHGFATDGFNVTSKDDGGACTRGNFSLSDVCLTSTSDDERSPCQLQVYLVCVMFALATALLRATLPPFGADQVRNHGLEVTRSFLAWYYWAANAGALLSYSVVTYLQHRIGFGAGFMTPFFLVVMSAVLFASGSHVYRWRPPNRTAVRNFFGILGVALRHCLRRAKHRDETHRNVGCFASAEVVNGGNYSSLAVEKVKAAGRICAALFLMLPFWIIYSRVKAAFAQEGLRMSQAGVNGELQIAPMFNNIGLCVALPLCNLAIYPLVGRYGYRMTMYRRFVIGMATGIVCLVTAGFVELQRINGLATGTRELIGGVYYNVSSVTIFWEIPQNFLLGATEACTIVTAMELTYIAAPRSMQCIMMGLFWMLFGVGDMLNVAVPSLPYGLPAAVQRDYHLKYFYFMVAAVLVGTVVLVGLIGRMFNLGLDVLTVPTARPLPAEVSRPAAAVAATVAVADRRPTRARYQALASSESL